MQFQSYNFILYFMPLCVAAYFFANKRTLRMRRELLTLCSAAFFAFAGWEALLVLCLSALPDLLLTRLLLRTREKEQEASVENGASAKRGGEREAKRLLLTGVLLHVILLVYFKLSHQLPLGISFYTFQQIAWLTEVYHEELREVGAKDYLFYLFFFPKITMGPLTSPSALITQVQDEKRCSFRAENAAAGIQMFAFGLAKKAVLADTFGSAVTWGFSSLSTATSADLILVMFAYTFQIYFDFSGYSDMAVGAALMLNFDLPINFDSPYRALSIRDFWKRWHISLTKWLTKYIYVPLGGNRKGEGRTYLNMMLVFLISGFWHGAAWTFVLWGALHGLLAVLERIGEGVLQKRSGICRKVPKALRWGVTFFLVNLLWLLFRAESVSQWAQMVAGMAGGRGFSISDGLIHSLYLPGYEVLGLTAMPYKMRGLLLFPLALLLCLLPQNQYRKRGGTKALTAVLSAVLIVWCLLGFTAETNFIYNNF